MIGVDTNVLVRYLTQDDPRQSPIATRFVEHQLSGDSPGFVSLVVLAETIWVLQLSYAVAKAELMPMLAVLAADPRFVVQSERAVWLALESCENNDVDLPDALINHINQGQGCTHTVTFDRKATRMQGMALLQ